MNYNSVQEIIDAGITNMTCLRNNSAQDDGKDTVTGADWLTFNGATVATIYVCGNTWFGFGSSTEHLKVNRRDAKMLYLYREEGTLYDYYNFIKIRWSGYSSYSQSVALYKLTYDVILFDTGDIMLHMVDIPSLLNDGVYELNADTTYSYTVSTTQPDVTFYKQESGGYTVQNEIANITAPFDRKYLIKNYTSDGYELLTVGTEGTLQTVPTLEITAETFQTYGFDSVPASDLLVTLSKFDVLLWYDSTEELPALTAEITATPQAQTVVTDLIDISDASILGIEAATVTATGSPLFALSFDNKETWEIWNGTAWETSSSGMAKDMIESITTEQWTEKLQSVTGFYLKIVLHDDDTVQKVFINFLNGGE